MRTGIDVIIPSFRLDEKYILPVLQLKKPENADIKFYLICDNPLLEIPFSVQSFIDNKNIFLIVNQKNIGAAASRNKGIDIGKSEWILFLDDDILVEKNLLEIYTTAIENFPGEIGFIGLITLPKPTTTFTKAIIANGDMEVFSIAVRQRDAAWGATANMMIKRSAVKDIRFSDKYPKSGGGEDVDFFIRVREKNNFQNYKCLPEANVFHGWWKNEKVDFSKPFRYGIGNSLLTQLNSKYAYRDFFNTPETLFLLIFPAIIFIIFQPKYLLQVLFFFIGILMIECIATFIQTLKRKNKVSFSIFGYAVLMRFVHECGLLYGNVSRLYFKGIGERFNMNGSLKKTHFYRTNTHKIVKLILYPLLVFIIWKYFPVKK